MERQRLRVQAGQAEALEAGNRMRTALLAAVSHDLRTPLASVKAAVSTLRQTDIAWTAEDQAALLATIEEGADRLDSLIGNLLDVTRIHTGALQPFIRPTALDEVAPLVVGGLDGGQRVRFDIPDALPLLATDPGLLERALANLIANALRYSPADQPPTLTAAARDGAVTVRVDRSRAAASHPTSETASSNRSSNSATSAPAAVSASGWPSPKASSTPSADSSPPNHTPRRRTHHAPRPARRRAHPCATPPAPPGDQRARHRR